MNPAYQVNLPPGYPPTGLAQQTSNVQPMPGVMPPLAYTHGLYTPVSPTYSAPGSLSTYQGREANPRMEHIYAANGAPAAGGGLLYEGNASPLIRPYGKASPYVVPATHTSYGTGMNSTPAHTQSAYSHSLAQTSGGTLYSAQSAYPPGMIPGIAAPPTNLLQAQQQQQQRQLYLQNSTQQAAINPAALGMSPAALAAARPSPLHAIPVSPGQNYQYAMMAAPPGGAIYPTPPTYYPSFAPVYQNNGVIP